MNKFLILCTALGGVLTFSLRAAGQGGVSLPTMLSAIHATHVSMLNDKLQDEYAVQQELDKLKNVEKDLYNRLKVLKPDAEKLTRIAHVLKQDFKKIIQKYETVLGLQETAELSIFAENISLLGRVPALARGNYTDPTNSKKTLDLADVQQTITALQSLKRLVSTEMVKAIERAEQALEKAQSLAVVPAQKSIEKPAGQLEEKPVPVPASVPVSTPAPAPAPAPEKPAEKPVGKPAEQIGRKDHENFLIDIKNTGFISFEQLGSEFKNLSEKYNDFVEKYKRHGGPQAFDVSSPEALMLSAVAAYETQKPIIQKAFEAVQNFDWKAANAADVFKSSIKGSLDAAAKLPVTFTTEWKKYLSSNMYNALDDVFVMWQELDALSSILNVSCTSLQGPHKTPNLGLGILLALEEQCDQIAGPGYATALDKVSKLSNLRQLAVIDEIWKPLQAIKPHTLSEIHNKVKDAQT